MAPSLSPTPPTSQNICPKIRQIKPIRYSARELLKTGQAGSDVDLGSFPLDVYKKSKGEASDEIRGRLTTSWRKTLIDKSIAYLIPGNIIAAGALMSLFVSDSAGSIHSDTALLVDSDHEFLITKDSSIKFAQLAVATYRGPLAAPEVWKAIDRSSHAILHGPTTERSRESFRRYDEFDFGRILVGRLLTLQVLSPPPAATTSGLD
ncbi:hypothetical protein PM082_015609 [Marasmius tenuissimus]|nr:hypothetical protein PM082_015609 [Marasmius tenuissimus]